MIKERVIPKEKQYLRKKEELVRGSKVKGILGRKKQPIQKDTGLKHHGVRRKQDDSVQQR